MSAPQDSASKGLILDFAGAEIDQPKENITNKNDEGDGATTITTANAMSIFNTEEVDHAADTAPLPSTSTAATRHHEQDDLNAPPKKSRRTRKKGGV